MSKEVLYTGYFVDDPAALLEQVPPRLTGDGVTLYAHHVTRQFMPPNGTKGLQLGTKRTFRIIGEVATDRVHAVLVESDDPAAISANKHLHITIATAPGVEAVESNSAIAEAAAAGTIIPIEPPITIELTEGYSDGERVFTA